MVLSPKLCTFEADNDKNDTIMTATATIQGVYVNVPAVDWSLFRELIRKFGWHAFSLSKSLRKITAL